MKDSLVTDRLITSSEAMKAVVYADYNKHDEELSGAHFDFNVQMSCRDILKAYQDIQNKLNGDTVARFSNNGIRIPLCLNEENLIFKGNCREFLERFNNMFGFVRITETDEVVSFIW